MQQPDFIRVALVEDQDGIRNALQQIVDAAEGMVCVEAFPDAESLIQSDLEAVDVVLLDIGLPGMSGTDAITHIRSRWAQADVLMLTVHQDEERVLQAVRLGAMGYLLKSTPTEQIIEAIRELKKDGAPMSPSVARMVMKSMQTARAEEESLTPREWEVVDLVLQGLSTRQIGEKLFISPDTAAFHIKQIYKKLHVHTRAEIGRRFGRR